MELVNKDILAKIIIDYYKNKYSIDPKPEWLVKAMDQLNDNPSADEIFAAFPNLNSKVLCWECSKEVPVVIEFQTMGYNELYLCENCLQKALDMIKKAKTPGEK